jgi:hypothetical protein
MITFTVDTLYHREHELHDHSLSIAVKLACSHLINTTRAPSAGVSPAFVLSTLFNRKNVDTASVRTGTSNRGWHL